MLLISDPEDEKRFFDLELAFLDQHAQGEEKYIKCKNDNFAIYVLPGQFEWIDCHICNASMCTKCGSAHNKQMSCQEFINSNLGAKEQDALVDQLIDGTFNFQKCPECGLIVERIAGCPKMTCVSQKCRNTGKPVYFCVFCGKNICKETYGHFDPGVCPKQPKN